MATTRSQQQMSLLSMLQSGSSADVVDAWLRSHPQARVTALMLSALRHSSVDPTCAHVSPGALNLAVLRHLALARSTSCDDVDHFDLKVIVDMTTSLTRETRRAVLDAVGAGAIVAAWMSHYRKSDDDYGVYDFKNLVTWLDVFSVEDSALLAPIAMERSRIFGTRGVAQVPAFIQAITTSDDWPAGLPEEHLKRFLDDPAQTEIARLGRIPARVLGQMVDAFDKDIRPHHRERFCDILCTIKERGEQRAALAEILSHILGSSAAITIVCDRRLRLRSHE